MNIIIFKYNGKILFKYIYVSIASRCIPHIALKAEGTYEPIVKKIRSH